MVNVARKQLQHEAAVQPVLFELLPPRFTLPQVQGLYEGVYNTSVDKRNFTRKLLSTGLLTRQDDKDKLTSRKGAFFYKINKKAVKLNFLQKDFFLSLK